jgi:hypothetical protein
MHQEDPMSGGCGGRLRPHNSGGGGAQLAQFLRALFFCVCSIGPRVLFYNIWTPGLPGLAESNTKLDLIKGSTYQQSLVCTLKGSTPKIRIYLGDKMQCNKHLQLQLSMVDIGVAKFTH